MEAGSVRIALEIVLEREMHIRKNLKGIVCRLEMDEACTTSLLFIMLQHTTTKRVKASGIT